MSDTAPLTVQASPFAMATFADVEKMAGYIAEAHVYGFKKPAQVISAMLLAHESNKSLSKLMEEKHFFEDGKISPKSSNLQAKFQKTGTILWHLRTNTVVAGSFFTFKPIKDEDRARACERFELQYEMDIMQMQPPDQESQPQAFNEYRRRESELLKALSKLARENECTIIRTMAQAALLGLADKSNYQLGAANMHQWRAVSDAIKLIAPEMLEGGSPDVDIQDLGMLNQQRALEQKSPQEREKESIQATIDGYLSEALESDPIRRRELHGLASELRCKLAEMEIAPQRTNTTVTDHETRTLRKESMPGMPGQPETGRQVLSGASRPISQGVAGDTSENPGTAREVECEVVREGVSQARKAGEDELPGLQQSGKSDAPPGLHQAAGGNLAVPKTSPGSAQWEQYCLTTIPAVKDKPLITFSKPEIKALHESLQNKVARGRSSAATQRDAEMVAMALIALKGGK